MERCFKDRTEAGKILAERLMEFANHPGILVLALPRGGVPVAFEVASTLKAPMDVFLVRKLGVPGQEELAMGAIATGGVRVLNDEVVSGFNIPLEVIDEITVREQQELDRRAKLYRGETPPVEVTGRTMILIDDGLATGSTVRAAVAALRQSSPARIIVAIPVAGEATCNLLRMEVDELVCAMNPNPFYAVGLHYKDFSQTTDQEVRDLLNRNVSDISQEPSRFRKEL